MKIQDYALQIRQDVFKMAWNAGGGHIAPAFSCADMMAVLYFDGVLQIDAANPKDMNRDFFILSKGHSALTLYSALSLAGFFDRELLWKHNTIGFPLGGHPRKDSVPGIEASTGSLGHGLGNAVGVALANQMDGRKNHVYVMLGDGECEEGSIWEGIMSAVHWKLDNLTVIVDYNKLQAMDRLETIMSISSYADKFKSFGFAAEEIDGHNHAEIKEAFLKRTVGKPTAVIAHTTKGKGISFMENVPIWHSRLPNEEELPIALRELHLTREDLEIK